MYTLKLKKLTKNWHDKDYLILHSCFQLLEDYVEVEAAHMEFYTFRNPYSYGTLKYKLFRFYVDVKDFFIKPKILPELGIIYLLRHQRDIEELNKKEVLEEFDLDQIKWLEDALIKESQILDLYFWWKSRDETESLAEDAAKERFDTFVQSMIQKYNLTEPIGKRDTLSEFLPNAWCWDLLREDNSNISEEDKKLFTELMDEYFGCDEKIYEMDNIMLKKLIDLRECMWT